jgi:gluconokinase
MLGTPKRFHSRTCGNGKAALHEHAGYEFKIANLEERMVVIVMGVVGSGKTTVGKLLAQQLGWQFADADDFHPPANIEKIHQGVPLDDQDRSPWLSALHEAIEQWNGAQQNVVLACSALKQSYREELRVGPVQFVYLKGSSDLILSRLRSRRGHFASESILASQFADLEEPDDAITVLVDQLPEEIVAEIRAQLKLPPLAYSDAAQI